MFERYTEKARRVIFFGRYEASQFGSPYIETEHLLLGLLREDKALATRFLGSLVGIESIRRQVEAHTTIHEKVSTSVDLPLSHECKRALAFASEEAERLKHDYISPGHLLIGLLRERTTFAAEILNARGVTAAGVREVAFLPNHEQRGDGGGVSVFLAKLSRDLTHAAGDELLTQAATDELLNKPAALDPLVDRVIEILWRRTQNRPVLLGESAATKTSIVERLAQRIAAHRVPAFFLDKRVLSIDIPQILAGAKDIREANRTVRRIASELVHDPNVIAFFVTDLDALFSPSSNQLLTDAEGIPDLPLTIAQLQCIVVASSAWFSAWIDSNPSLQGHFESVHVPISREIPDS